MKNRVNERIRMKTDSSYGKRKYALIFFLFALGIMVYILFSTDVFDDDYKKIVRPFSTGWHSAEGVEYNIDYVRTRGEGDVITLEKKLPDGISDGDGLCFETNNADVQVYINHREIYSFTARENFTGRGYGNAFHIARLSPFYAGGTVRIIFKCVDPTGGRASVSDVYIGPQLDYVHMSIISRSPSAIVSVLIIVFGLMLLIIYVWVPDKKRLPFDIASLGIAAAVIGVWLFTDSNILQLLSGHIYAIRAVNRISMTLVGYPVISFFNSLTKADRRIFRIIAFWANIIFVALVVGIRFITGIDMIRYFLVSLVLFGAFSLALIVFIFVDNQLYCKANGIEPNLKMFYIAVSVFTLCVIADIILYYNRLSFGDSYGTFTRLGTLFILISVMISFLNWWIRDQADIERDRLVNRVLKYAVSSYSPDESIRLMMESVGKELQAQRIVVLENTNNGKFHGTYAWYEEGRKPGAIDLLYIPQDGYLEELHKNPDIDDHRLIISNLDEYKSSNSPLYNLLITNNVEKLAASSLELNGKLIGIFAVLDPPTNKLSESAEIINLISYFVSQLIMRRDEEKRLRFYSYNDTLSGALNRMAYREYIESGLDMGSSFGYMICEIEGLERANDTKGYEAGDKMVIGLVNCLMDVFGNDNVYRVSGTEFVAFGFESEETFFYNDVDRVRKMTADMGLSIFVGAVFCVYGTLDISMVIGRANELLIEDKKNATL